MREGLGMTTYKCLECGHVFGTDAILPVCGKCEGWVEVYFSESQLKTFWKNGSGSTENAVRDRMLDNSLWRYRDILPINNPENIISMGTEGGSSLIHLARLGEFIGHPKVFLRDERKGTGSFKDLAASVFTSFLKERGVDTFVVASTGNIGTAYAAYAARAGIQMYVCIPELSAVQKADEVSAYGARVIRVKGDYAAAKKFAKDLAKLHGWISDFNTRCPIRWEAKKTMAFTEFEALGDLPDVYVQALSGGSGFLGYAKGVKELQMASMTKKTPRMFGIQASGCAPMAEAFASGNDEKYQPILNPETSVATLATGDPTAYSRLAPIFRSSKGAIMAIPEESVIHAAVLLGRMEGILVDPATATALSGLLFAIKNGKIGPNEIVVVNGGASVFRDIHFMGNINGYVNMATRPEEVVFGKKTGEKRFEEAKRYFGRSLR